MAKKTLSQLTSDVSNKVQTIKLVELSALQSTNGQKALYELRTASGEISKAVAENQDKNTLLEKHDELVQAVDTAGLLGVISNEEITEYYSLLDAMWAAIEKE